MVGDSAIGKTSLMVKYVEGAFDEDYIQTLGSSPKRLSPDLTFFSFLQVSISWRKQLVFEIRKSHSRYGI